MMSCTLFIHRSDTLPSPLPPPAIPLRFISPPQPESVRSAHNNPGAHSGSAAVLAAAHPAEEHQAGSASPGAAPSADSEPAPLAASRPTWRQVAARNRTWQVLGGELGGSRWVSSGEVGKRALAGYPPRAGRTGQRVRELLWSAAARLSEEGGSLGRRVQSAPADTVKPTRAKPEQSPRASLLPLAATARARGVERACTQGPGRSSGGEDDVVRKTEFDEASWASASRRTPPGVVAPSTCDRGRPQRPRPTSRSPHRSAAPAAVAGCVPSL
ncbi:hypothetical protein HPB47_012006 [Ixodes persulcatus]|uniref:Uncharacterized protein n=1 Tax=Ixodes persulcatus TaxID=34615 RepID=A0AC60NUQ8_IXOPE|nr:hypothetical protein HPB47_012006 [Ixodes persulcatus]